MPTPLNIHLHRASLELELEYSADERYHLPCEYLRVYSPSAEVRGHGHDQATLQTGKKYVSIQKLNPSGNYALQIVFSDGHDSGIYSWDYLYDLCQHYDANWADYLKRLDEQGASRNPDTQPIIFKG